MFTVLDAHLQICTHKNAQVFLRLLFGIKKKWKHAVLMELQNKKMGAGNKH